MYYYYAEAFWKNALKALAEGGCDQGCTSPLILLQKDEAAGKFYGENGSSVLTKEHVNCVEMAKLWGDDDSTNVITIVNRAFRELPISEQTIEKVASLLAHDTIAMNFNEIDPKRLAPECYVALPVFPDSEEPDATEDEIESPEATGPDGSLPAERMAGARHGSPRRQMKADAKAWTPQEIYDYLDDHIIGQEAAKRAASMLVFSHLHHQPRNLAIAGPTGSGKTEIWRALSKVFDFIRVVDASNLGPAGWKANMHIADIFAEVPSEMAEHFIIVWDEFDKACEPAIGRGGTDFARLLQGELLRMLDGDEVEFYGDDSFRGAMTVNCKNISNVFTGSFERMLQEKSRKSGGIGFCKEARKEAGYEECRPEDLVKYGNVRQEIAGRISRVETLTLLTKEDFVQVLSDETVSPLVQAQRGFHLKLTMDSATKARIAEEAVRSGMGARYLRSEVQRRVDELLFANPTAKELDLSDAKEVANKSA